MNVRRVMIWMTVGVFFILTVLATLFFHGIPPWPVLACFAISHSAFCLIISRVKPYKGPYTQPMEDPTNAIDAQTYRGAQGQSPGNTRPLR
jgi:hypothetical protein